MNSIIRKYFIFFVYSTCLFSASCSDSLKVSTTLGIFPATSMPNEKNVSNIPVQKTRDEYIEWYTSSKEALVVKNDTLGYSFNMKYIPKEVEALTLAKVMDLPDSALDSLLTLKSDYSYFEFSLSSARLSSQKIIREAANSHHGLFEMQKDFSAVTKGDTVHCAWAEPMRERLAQTGEMVYRLGFKGRQSWDNAQLLYHDRLFNTGIREFSFKNTLVGLPTLKQ